MRQDVAESGNMQGLADAEADSQTAIRTGQE
jgi:hypothetical protein